MSIRATAGKLATILSLCLGFTSHADAQCNFQGQAAAGIQAFNGGVTSSHFGQITNVNCTHSRKMLLRATTLVNGSQVASHDEHGGKADLGAWVDFEEWYMACSGTFSSTSRFGTTFLGVPMGWLDTDLSSLTEAYCLPDDGDGGGGGGGGVGGCSVTPGETTTYTLSAYGVERSPGGDGSLGLSKTVARPEGRFLAEEWAVVSAIAGKRRVEFASSDRFVSHVEAAPRLLQRLAGGGSAVLLVEAADHPLNHRYMPTPRVADLQVAVGWSPGEDAQEFWFRAEVAEAGEVDRLLLLDSSDPARNSAVRAALRDRLNLQYADARRHRAVVFGRAVVSAAGILSVRDPLVLVPKCCCGTEEVICL